MKKLSAIQLLILKNKKYLYEFSNGFLVGEMLAYYLAKYYEGKRSERTIDGRRFEGCVLIRPTFSLEK